MNNSKEIQKLYEQLIEAWNNRDAGKMARLFEKDGELIGYDGSQAIGSDEIFSHVQPIFAEHPTAPYVSKVKQVEFLSSDVAIVRAIVGMIPIGQSKIDPKVNAHHTLIAVNDKGNWRVRLFQNTPAQFHGRPELVERMTEELEEQV